MDVLNMETKKTHYISRSVYFAPDLCADVFLNKAMGNWVDYTLARAQAHAHTPT